MPRFKNRLNTLIAVHEKPCEHRVGENRVNVLTTTNGKLVWHIERHAVKIFLNALSAMF